MSGKFTSQDRGANQLLLGIRDAKKRALKVRVGVLSDAPKREPDGGTSTLSLVEVAAVHEFGAPSAGIPQRSFVRATVDTHRGEIRALQERLAGQILRGELPAETALHRLGAFVAGLMQRTITAGIAPPLKPETVARKGSSTPLIDSGQLRSAIVWEVV